MTHILIETQCLPPVPLFQLLRHIDVLRIEAYEHYQKRSFRNRIYLAGPQGLEIFTIPLKKGKHQAQDITNVAIAYDEDWIRRFTRLLQSNYGSAPYYHHYIDQIVQILHQQHQLLLYLNMSLLRWVLHTLQIPCQLQLSQNYNLGDRDPLLRDLRNTITPKAINPCDKTVNYNQVYEDRHGFIPNLSILDMIMCCGPESIHYL